MMCRPPQHMQLAFFATAAHERPSKGHSLLESLLCMCVCVCVCVCILALTCRLELSPIIDQGVQDTHSGHPIDTLG